MKLKLQLRDIEVDAIKISNVEINVEYNVDELRTLTLSYEKMIPLFGDLILKATQQPTA